MINTLKTIGLGVVIGVLSSIGLSLTLEEEVSEWRMGVYGGFISLISASSSVASAISLNRKNEEANSKSFPDKSYPNLETQEIIARTIERGFETHLNSLQAGSPEYLQALERYGTLLSAKTFPPATTPKKN